MTFFTLGPSPEKITRTFSWGGVELNITFTSYNPSENIKSLKTTPILPEGHITEAIERKKNILIAEGFPGRKRILHSFTPHSEPYQTVTSVLVCFGFLRHSIQGDSVNPLLELFSCTTHRVKNSFPVITIQCVCPQKH